MWLILLLFVWGWWMFLWEWGQVLLLSLEPISGEARGHPYISSAVRHNSRRAAANIWRLYSRTTFEDILNLTSKHLLQSWHRFYLIAWGMTTMSISSKYLRISTKLWIDCFFLLLFKSNVAVFDNPFRAYSYVSLERSVHFLIFCTTILVLDNRSKWRIPTWTPWKRIFSTTSAWAPRLTIFQKCLEILRFVNC